MTIILLTFLLLCLLPILLVVLFQQTLAERKQGRLLDDLKKLNAFNLPVVKSKGGKAGIAKDISTVYSLQFLFPPAVLLSLLYLPGFVLCFVALGYGFPWLFPGWLVAPAKPVAFAFTGVYLFNLGSMVRRLYLSDLTEHVFWGSINRLLLSVGVAIVIATTMSSDGTTSAVMYFAIGFLANAFLQGVLQAGLRIGKISRSKTADLPLQLVRGINIWKEYRLEEEGIEDIQNLATADVIDLAVKTHYRLRTLIDWVDQSVLIVRLGKEKTTKLWELGVPVSAIDLAWQSPENSKGSGNADALAAKLEMDPLFMGNLMNALFEDVYVQTLWTMWQTGPDRQTYPLLPDEEERPSESDAA
jgi:hypothetical protein